MERKHLIISAALILGLLAGAAASVMTERDQSQCDRTEETLRERADVGGALACFPPGVIDVNMTDRVEEGAELECVCRQSHDGNVRIFAINRAS